MFNRLIIAFVGLLLSSCMTSKPKSGFEEIADFGLADDGAGVTVDDKAYFDDLNRSESSIGFESSLPLPFRVGKSGDSFDGVPTLAKPSLESRLRVQMGPCTFTLLSGPIQIDRYLLAGQWIKLTEGLPSKTPVKLEPKQDLNIKAVTKIGIEVSETAVPICRRMFEGQKVFIGRFHLNKSRLGLVPGPGAPKIAFAARSLEPQGKMLFIHWRRDSNAPSVIDDFDFPATAESGIFRAQMANQGYYYLAFQTVLRMDKLDSMVIKLPVTEAMAQAVRAPAVAPMVRKPAPQVLKAVAPLNQSSRPTPKPGHTPVNTVKPIRKHSGEVPRVKALVKPAVKAGKSAVKESQSVSDPKKLRLPAKSNK